MSLPVYNGLVEFILRGKTPEEVLAYKATEEESKRISELLEKEKSGLIDESEKTELDYYMVLEHAVLMAKVKAHQQLRA